MIKRKEKVKRSDNILSEKKAKMIDASEKLKNFRSFSYERCRSVDSDGDEVPNLDSFELQIELTKSNIQLADMRSEYALLKLKRISLRNEIERHIRSLKTKRNLLVSVIVIFDVANVTLPLYSHVLPRVNLKVCHFLCTRSR